MKKTLEEIEELKRMWKSDPCWDIEDEEGFEDHKEELKTFRLECEYDWKHDAWERDKKAAAEMRLSMGDYREYETQMRHSTNQSAGAKKLLKHYFKFSVSPYDSDNASEIEEIVDCIIEAAVAEVKAEIIKSTNSSKTA